MKVKDLRNIMVDDFKICIFTCETFNEMNDLFIGKFTELKDRKLLEKEVLGLGFSDITKQHLIIV